MQFFVHELFDNEESKIQITRPNKTYHELKKLN